MQTDNLQENKSLISAFTLFIARTHSYKPNNVSISSIDEKNIYAKVKTDTENIRLKLPYSKTLKALALWLLNDSSTDEVNGYHSILTLSEEDLINCAGYWFNSQLDEADMSYIARKIYIHDDLEEAIECVLEYRYETLYENPRRRNEIEAREFLREQDFYNLDNIPAETWLTVLNQDPTPSSNSIIEAIIEYLETQPNIKSETITNLREALSLKRYTESIEDALSRHNQATDSQSQEVSITRYRFLIERYAKKNLSPGKAVQKIIRFDQAAKQISENLEQLFELWARIGENSLILKHFNPIQHSKFIYKAVATKQSAETCFEEILIFCAEANPQLCEIENKQIRYVVKAQNNVLKMIKDETLSLFKQKILKPGEALPTGIDAIILNTKLEVLGILVYIQQGLYFDKAEDAQLPTIFAKTWLNELSTDAASQLDQTSSEES